MLILQHISIEAETKGLLTTAALNLLQGRTITKLRCNLIYTEQLSQISIKYTINTTQIKFNLYYT